ncbi:3,4-dihydroxy-2-butanone-4-phosphate synthase [Gracilimonas amylolytica]|uniref:3,4-dihydroxy-2-butanone-4-phosphate synthase n=1 Tax=Gracilimonas amylolytica TaxID=1749045 RepID=UPI000CD8FDB5|nr:3,4-dihydroxy-2-butanone-4-phosphate synthase [Gracilimonas amylolytica]
MSQEFTFNTIPEAIEDIKNGKIVIVVDDEDRENEGDFLMAAEMVTNDAINLMVTHGRGLVCAPITKEKADKLKLKHMVQEGADPDEANFTISIDHKRLTTTGISAADRANTIRELASDDSKPVDFRRPGHVFPLLAVEGGVLRRAGHTEAAIDLARLAGLKPVGIICEIMKEDGEMARVPELIKMAKEFEMKIITIKDLIAYRNENETLVHEVMDVNLPTMYGDFSLRAFKEKLTGDIHLALTKGTWSKEEPVLTRVHSSDLIGDIFGARNKDTSEQLHQAMLQVEREGQGVVLYMNRNQRGSVLVNQLKTLKALQKGKLESNEEDISPRGDARDYGVGAQILRSLGIRKLRLMTNNPVKRIGIKSFGLEIVDQVPISPNFDFSAQKYPIEGEKNS